MNKVDNEPSRSKWIEWFNPQGRNLEGITFSLNRITGLGLTLYLFLHLIVLGTLARGANAYDNFIKLVHNPFFIFGEFLVVAAGLIHGFNGIRIVITSLGIGVPTEKRLLVVLMAIALIGTLIFAVRMFTA
ncbi:MAG TPA: hypothetical protein VMT46_00120 [Anaerolineaceae bacterium]|nr:hypothetical protein [Anaerolineaceae bacterium]